MVFPPASPRGLRTTCNHITAARLRSPSRLLRLPSAASYPPGSSLTLRDSTKRLASTSPSHSAWLRHVPVSSSTSVPAMRKSVGRWSVSCRCMDMAPGQGVGTRPRSGGGWEIVIRGLSLHPRYFTRFKSRSCHSFITTIVFWTCYDMYVLQVALANCEWVGWTMIVVPFESNRPRPSMHQLVSLICRSFRRTAPDGFSFACERQRRTYCNL
jgi:hypothetical protein